MNPRTEGAIEFSLFIDELFWNSTFNSEILTNNGDHLPKYWFSWFLLENACQSPEFEIPLKDRNLQLQPKIAVASKDSYQVYIGQSGRAKIPYQATSSIMQEIFPLQVFLCSDEGIKGSFTINSFSPSEEMEDINQTMTGVFCIEPVNAEENYLSHLQVKLRIQVAYTLPEINHKDSPELVPPSPPNPESDRSFPESLILDWELYRQRAEAEWKLSLIEKEKKMREKLEQEYQSRFQNALEDLRRSQQEVSKLEIRLKSSLEAVSREKSSLLERQHELQRELREKTSELQMYSRKYKSEAKELVEQERLEKSTLKKQLTLSTQQCEALEKKYADLLEQYNRIQLKLDQSDQTILKDQLMEARNALARTEALLESEVKQKAILTLEKEQYRAQVYNLANCLKKERELSSLRGKQELEKLRLEFLMREER